MASARDEARFFAKVSPEPNTGCWLWVAAVDASGYGRFGIGSRQVVAAHRFAFGLAMGFVPPSALDLCHRCDTPSCVNPAHIFVGTRTDNMRDCSAKGRVRNHNTGKTHCKRGHLLDEENTRIVAGGRECRRCSHEKSMAWQRANRDERNARQRARRAQLKESRHA